MNKRSPRLFFAPNRRFEHGLTLLELLAVLVLAPVLIFSSSVMYLKTVQIIKTVHDRSQALMERQLVLDYLRRTVPNGSRVDSLSTTPAASGESFTYQLTVSGPNNASSQHDVYVYKFHQLLTSSVPQFDVQVTLAGSADPSPLVILSYTSTIRPPTNPLQPFAVSGDVVTFNFNFFTNALDPARQLIPASTSLQLRGGL